MDDIAGNYLPPAVTVDELLVRPGTNEDKNFIFSTWLKCYRRHSLFTRNISNDVYFDWHQKVINRLFNRGATATVAALKEDPMVVLGYLVTEEVGDVNPIIHFAYVKFAFQKCGIMRTLLFAARIELKAKTEYTHHTFEIEPIIAKYPNMSFNPYLL